MKSSALDLEQLLKQDLNKVYLILGQESLQIQEVVDQVTARAREEDFLEKQTHIVTKQMDWSFLASSSQNLDLFGAKKIIEIKLIGSGPGAAGAKALKEFAKEESSLDITIISGEGLDKKSYSSAWVRALEEVGTLIIIDPIYLNQLPSWILKTGEKNDLQITKEASVLLAERTEGNLLATLQEIKKLTLLYPNQDIGIEEMASSIADSSKFNIFDLSNAFISGNKERTANILESLRAEGAPETLVLWSLSREITNLHKVVNQGSVKGIWGPKHYLDSLENTARRINNRNLKLALKQVAAIDSSIKGQNQQNAWQAIRELTLSF